MLSSFPLSLLSLFFFLSFFLSFFSLFYYPWKIEFRLSLVRARTSGPSRTDGLCLVRSPSLRARARASLNTSFPTFRQRNSILARDNEISAGARRVSSVIRILRRTTWHTIRASSVWLPVEGKSSLARIRREEEKETTRDAMLDTRARNQRGRPVFLYYARDHARGRMIYKRDN